MYAQLKIVKLNAMCYSGLNPETEKGHQWEYQENLNKVWNLVDRIALPLVSQF